MTGTPAQTSEPSSPDMTTQSSIVEQTAAFICERFPGFASTDVTGETPLLDDGEIDSLGILDLMMFLEERFGVAMSDDDFQPEHFETLNALAQLVLTKQAR